MEFPHIPICLNTSDHDINTVFYGPCLKWAGRYDRGVGYFTSGWISRNACGLAEFASKNGRARWITSPLLAAEDLEVIRGSLDVWEIIPYFRSLLDYSLETLVRELEKDTLNALAWMIFDNIVEFRFAIPTKKLIDGDFHDKFGIFYDYSGNSISFTGSINDSAKGLSNYESIKVFKSWEGMGKYIEQDAKRFERLWNNDDPNVLVLETDEALRNDIIKCRIKARPYVLPSQKKVNLWVHQQEAVDSFIASEHGILEMATGTGKTKTSLAIISNLLANDKADTIIVIAYGNDLLLQWEKELLLSMDNVQLFRFYGTEYREMPAFLLCNTKRILLISRDAERLGECFRRLRSRFPDALERTLIVVDEVHGLGSVSFRESLSGMVKPYKYRLGLSATPEREYDAEGNTFLLEEIGPIIYRFSLEDAIKKGILCEFSYYPLEYEITDEEKRKKQAIIASYSTRRKNGEPVCDTDMYRDLAEVNKTSIGKLPVFQAFLNTKPEILDQCILFVETREYGILVQKMIIKFISEFHTYYGNDDSDNLLKFAQGQLKCLITCKKISEGIDIKTVKNIVLFASDRAKLSTIQRVGRSLRVNHNEPLKCANIIDFICVKPDLNDSETLSTDQERKDWLTKLSEIRREL